MSKAGFHCHCPPSAPYLSSLTHTCITCNAPQYWNLTAGTCQSCPPNFHYNAPTSQCVCCPPGFLFDTATAQCLCSGGAHFDPNTRKCVLCNAPAVWNSATFTCGGGAPVACSGATPWLNPATGTCSACPANKPIWNGKTCVSCPVGSYYNPLCTCCRICAPGMVYSVAIGHCIP